MRHPAKWIAPDPFWSGAEAEPAGFLRPRILRFSSDAFMEDLFGLLRRDPRGLPALEAEPETWRGPSRRGEDVLRTDPDLPSPSLFRSLRRKLVARGAAPAIEASRTGTLKLYQPAHQRHYLVSAVLACERPGFPDRSVDRGHNQSVSLLVRKLVAPSGISEAAFAAGPSFDLDGHLLSGWTEAAFLPDGSPRWVAADAPEAVVDGEERLPLFPASYEQDDGRCRRLFLGTIPVGRREAYQNAGSGRPVPRAQRTPDQRREELGELLDKLVLGPWRALSESCYDASGASPVPEVFQDGSDASLPAKPDTSNFHAGRLRSFRSRIQFASWSILAELREFLLAHGTAPVRAALENGTASAAPLSILQSVSWQGAMGTAPGFAPHLAASLSSVSKIANRAKISAFDPGLVASYLFDVPQNQTQAIRDLVPDFVFLLVDPATGFFPGCVNGPSNGRRYDKVADAPGDLTSLDHELSDLREALLDLVDLGRKTSLPDRIEAPSRGGDAWYAVRLVMEHPECVHHDPVFSRPTSPFRMASFFDSDAPVRPVRIGLPVDPTPEGLRKADRNTVFLLSDAMCAQVGRMKGIGFIDLVLSVLPWPFHKDLPTPPPGDCKKGDDLGMMLVMSIPIITICALIILIIMVTLLDMVFKWLPFFLFWIPIRKNGSGKLPL